MRLGVLNYDSAKKASHSVDYQRADCPPDDQPFNRFITQIDDLKTKVLEGLNAGYTLSERAKRFGVILEPEFPVPECGRVFTVLSLAVLNNFDHYDLIDGFARANNYDSFGNFSKLNDLYESIINNDPSRLVLLDVESDTLRIFTNYDTSKLIVSNIAVAKQAEILKGPYPTTFLLNKVPLANVVKLSQDEHLRALSEYFNVKQSIVQKYRPSNWFSQLISVFNF